MFVHTVSEACRLLPSSSRWNSIEVPNYLPPVTQYNDLPPKYTKSYEGKLTIVDRKKFKWFLYITGSLLLLKVALVLLLHFLPRKQPPPPATRNFTIPVHQALSFFDAQKSGHFPDNSSVKFRGDSGLKDGYSTSTTVNLTGGYYDSGNNIKFTFPTAYTITLLSWTVIEYHEKYTAINEIDHVKDIIKWGTDYLLKVFVPSASGSIILYSQVGNTDNRTTTDNDINCWQRPEDMAYERTVSFCKNTASDLAGEIIAALSAASLVLKEDKVYSATLIKAAEHLYGLVHRKHRKPGMYTMDNDCGGKARSFYNSSGYLDELVWGGTWLFFATGNMNYLQYATKHFKAAMKEEMDHGKGLFDWNNKLVANAVLLTRFWYFRDPGYPYEEALVLSARMSKMLMCSYVSKQNSNSTSGGLILFGPNKSGHLQYAATSSFLSKLYSDYLYVQNIPGMHCGTTTTSVAVLKNISSSQVDYILGKNPKKMSYLVGFGDNFPKRVHHRAASIPWDSQRHSCRDGTRWLHSKDPNPNVLVGAMVAGPDKHDNFIDSRDQPQYTEPTISGNAGLVAALIALHELPPKSPRSGGNNLGLDERGMFANVPSYILT